MSQLKKSIKKRPWYTRIDYEIFIKPLIAIGILILLYLAWVKRDVWIPRLLTSQTRLRHTIMKNEEKLGERGDTSITNKDSSSNSDEDDIMDDDDEKNNDQISNEDNDDDNTPLTHSKHSSQKINIRIRRNKMSFSKDKAKKTRGSKYRLSDDGDDDDDDDDDDDADVDVDEVDENNDDDDEDNVKENNETEQIVVKPIKGKENVIAPSKKRHNPRTTPSHEPKTQAKAKTTLILRSHDDIVDQLNKLVKSRGKKYDLSTLLIKQTGLTKAKINRFIHGKDFSIVTLDQINSVLNKFHSTLLIVSK